jgi:hypothetical protein
VLRHAVKWQELQDGVGAKEAPRVVEVRSPAARARLRDLGEELANAHGVSALRTAATLVAERRKATRS